MNLFWLSDIYLWLVGTLLFVGDLALADQTVCVFVCSLGTYDIAWIKIVFFVHNFL
jgi:hypothetical protein